MRRPGDGVPSLVFGCNEAHRQDHVFPSCCVSTIAVMAAKKKEPGRNIDESERHTLQVKLRLPPDVAERLDELAERWGVTRSGAVALLLEKHGGR